MCPLAASEPKVIRSVDCMVKRSGRKKKESKSRRLPTTIIFIGFTKSTRDFTIQKPGQPLFFNGLGSLGKSHGIRWRVSSQKKAPNPPTDLGLRPSSSLANWRPALETPEDEGPIPRGSPTDCMCLEVDRCVYSPSETRALTKHTQTDEVERVTLALSCLAAVYLATIQYL